MPQLPPSKKAQFPAIPEFYGGELGPQVSPETATNQSDWSDQYRKSVPPTQPLLDVLLEIANDPRNAWMGLGPVGMAVKGSRLIKPLVEAEKFSHVGTVPAKTKTLKHAGSEPAAKILDFDPQLGHTTHPEWGGPRENARSFAESGGMRAPLLEGQVPPTVDEIVAAQDILKKIAQQNAPKELTLYRGGEPVRRFPMHGDKPWTLNPNTPVPATSSLETATQFMSGGGKPLFELKVPREDLLANIEKLQRGRGYRESEYLIPLRAFQNAQTRLPFENPTEYSGHKFEGAKIQPYSDLHEKWPYAQQSMSYSPPVKDLTPGQAKDVTTFMDKYMNPTKKTAPLGFEELAPGNFMSTNKNVPGFIIYDDVANNYLVDVNGMEPVIAKNWNAAIDKLHAIHSQLKQKPLAQ